MQSEAHLAYCSRSRATEPNRILRHQFNSFSHRARTSRSQGAKDEGRKGRLVLSLRARRILRRRQDFPLSTSTSTFSLHSPPLPFPSRRPLSRWRSFGLRSRTRAPSSVNQFPAPYTSPSRIARRDNRREFVRLIKSRRL